MNFSTFKTRVKLRLSNMATGDPFESYVDDWVNEALNGLVLRATSKKQRSLMLFPELRDQWQDTTVAGQEYIAIPSDILVLEEVKSYDKTGASRASDRSYPMHEITMSEWDVLDKSSTIERYPRLWTKYGNQIFLHAIPRAGFTTDLLLSGIARENALVNNADEPVLDALWHPAVEDYAVWLGCTAMGWHEEADRALAVCDQKISNAISILGLERSSGKARVRVKNDPTCSHG